MAASAAAAAAASSNSADRADDDKDLSIIESLIGIHPDFPSKGVLFRDLFPVFRSPQAAEALLARLYRRIYGMYTNKISAVIGLEVRGFLMAPVLALRLGCAFVPSRKKGKLPGLCVSAAYVKEYGKDEIEAAADSLSQKDTVVILDDLLATGGTLIAAIECARKCGATVAECIVVVELKGLKGRQNVEQKTGCKVWSLFQYD
jgi:adenine phosphoribosyltransferase